MPYALMCKKLVSRPTFFLFLFFVSSWMPIASAADLPDGTIRFHVIRDGTVIGMHTIDARHEGDKLIIDINIDLAVDILFATVYRYEQKRQEIWQNGRLVQFQGTANDDGDKFTTQGAVDGDAILVKVTGDADLTHRVPLDAVPNSYWNMELIRQTRALHTTDGRYVPITVTDMGKKITMIAGKETTIHRYRIDGLETQQGRGRELWYDDNGHWVGMLLVGGDDSTVEWQLQ